MTPAESPPPKGQPVAVVRAYASGHVTKAKDKAGK